MAFLVYCPPEQRLAQGVRPSEYKMLDGKYPNLQRKALRAFLGYSRYWIPVVVTVSAAVSCIGVGASIAQHLENARSTDKQHSEISTLKTNVTLRTSTLNR